MAWKWAAASRVGTSHIRSGSRLQDAYAVSHCGDGWTCAIVADGAGSATFSAFGAWLSCRILTSQFRSWCASANEIPDDDEVLGWVDELRDRISYAALKRNSEPRQFASTLAALLIGPRGSLAIHVGDSSIVGRRDEGWEVICWPENGEYASTTFFLTDDPQPKINILRLGSEFDAFALFSDGIGDLALSQKDHQAHRKFFDPMIRPIDDMPDTGRLSVLSQKLGSYLASDAICERTDDDKTLILLSRK